MAEWQERARVLVGQLVQERATITAEGLHAQLELGRKVAEGPVGGVLAEAMLGYVQQGVYRRMAVGQGGWAYVPAEAVLEQDLGELPPPTLAAREVAGDVRQTPDVYTTH
jgi:hypothetical protein